MKDATKRSILRWIHFSSLAFRSSVMFIVRLKKFQITPPLFGLSPFLYLSFRDFGCGKAMSFDDLCRKDRPNKESVRNELAKIQFSWGIFGLTGRYESKNPQVRNWFDSYPISGPRVQNFLERSYLHQNGKYVVGVCPYKHHLTFSPWSPRVIEDFKERLGKFIVFKNCFQIPVDWEIDRELVKDLVRARLAELD
jgi:hypothetical protein